MRQTPSSAVWGLIESALYASNIKKKDLAKIAGVHANTVSRDAENPDHIPLGRVCLYCTVLNIPPEQIASKINQGFCG